MATNTPLHTLDILEKEISETQHQGKGDAKFVSIDTRVLEWLIADSRALNAIEVARP